ncbi:hypothetical protein GGF37_000275 [Kickxella alabastrina]|nr:hypothetical protein GGF37_000275 [Kickxella alabastrina]
MVELMLRYMGDMDQELVMTRGISAQTNRTRRRRGLTMPRPQTPLPRPSTMSALPSPPPIESFWSNSMRSSKPLSSPSIPLRMLLPSNAPTFKFRTESYLMASSVPTSPTFGSKELVFSDAHVEYVGGDCVIHNGMQMVDITLEFAAQRAAPKLVSYPFKA